MRQRDRHFVQRVSYRRMNDIVTHLHTRTADQGGIDPYFGFDAFAVFAGKAVNQRSFVGIAQGERARDQRFHHAIVLALKAFKMFTDKGQQTGALIF